MQCLTSLCEEFTFPNKGVQPMRVNGDLRNRLQSEEFIMSMSNG